MVASLPLSPLTASVGSSLFSSIFINQASSSMLLEEEEDMMPGLIDLTENSKKREQRISPRYGDQQVREVFIDFLSWRTSIR